LTPLFILLPFDTPTCQMASCLTMKKKTILSLAYVDVVFRFPRFFGNFQLEKVALI